MLYNIFTASHKCKADSIHLTITKYLEGDI